MTARLKPCPYRSCTLSGEAARRAGSRVRGERDRGQSWERDHGQRGHGTGAALRAYLGLRGVGAFA